MIPGKCKLWTKWFHCYAAIRLVERGRRYILKSRLVTQLELSETPKIVEELVAEAKLHGVHIRLLLLDKGFCSEEVVKVLKTVGIKLLMAVPKRERVKEAILDCYWTGKGQARRFPIGKETFNLTIHMGLKEALRAWNTLPGEYRSRWGLEAGFMVEKGFRAKTTSINEAVMETCHQYAFFLENLWGSPQHGRG